MNVVDRPQRAAPPAGAAFAYHRTGRLAKWLGWGRSLRLLLPLAAGLLGELITRRSGGLPFPLTPAVSLLAGALFGGLGIAGAALGQLAAVRILHPGFLAALTLAVSYSLTGVAGWAVFRFVPQVGRGIPNLRSFLWTLGAALAGGLAGALTALLAGGLQPVAGTAGWIWSWVTGGLISVALLAPPVLLAADRYGRSWLLPLPGELRLTDPLERELAGRGQETLILFSPAPRPDSGRSLGLGAGMVLATTAVALSLVRLLPGESGWTALLYLLPILWAALRYGLRGGILAASASGVCHLLGLAVLAAFSRLPGIGLEALAGRPDLLILALAGAVVGWSRERELSLREELVESNRLLRRDLVRVSDALMQAVEAKDAYTGGHLRRVGEYAVAVGEKLGLRGQSLETLHYASLLHDVGKLAVPESVLSKEGPLTAGEMEMMRRHPEVGARMLERLELLSGAVPLVLHHQERFDGELAGKNPGYPRGLAGKEIPLGARIIAVVDAFDAMTTTRPYRPALSQEAASAVLRRERGRQFDPDVVDTFLDCLAERPWRV
jgi:HD-GYP domain-containing protein (c-di-GMP phosphodiesterase class II)